MDLQRFIHSDKADELKINNTPNEDMKNRCLLFLLHAVEPLETLFSPKKVAIHSGYRCTKLNTVVGGKTFSQHLRGNSIDCHIEGLSVPDAYRIIKNSSLWYDQLLLEGRDGHQWIHMSYNTDLIPGKQRMQALELPNA